METKLGQIATIANSYFCIR